MNKLIMFLPSVNNGGNEKNFFSTANNLSKKKIRISVITCSGKRAKKKIIFRNNCRFLNFEFFNLKLKYFISFFYLIIHSSKSTPILSFQGNILAIIAAKIIGTKVHIRFNSHPHNFIKNKFKKFVFKFFYKMADNTIVNSKEIQKTLRKEYGLSSYLIKNEIDINKIYKLASKKVSFNFFKNKSHKLFINVGRLDKNKNQSFLINSLYKLEKKYKFNLIILGSGDEKLKLLKLIKKLNLDNYVKLLDFKKNPFPYVYKSDVFILSSFYEGYPNVLLEAGILKKTIISSDCLSGPSEIIKKNKNGYLYKSNNYLSFRNTIKKLYMDPKKIIQRKKSNLEKYIKNNHDKDNSKFYIKLIFKK